MNLIDHEDLEAPDDWLVHRLLQQQQHIINTAVGGSVQLGVVHEAAAVDVGTSLANTTRRGRDAALAVWPDTVQRFGQNTRNRGLANAPRAGEQVGMVQTLRCQRIAQRLHHMRLADHFREIFGTVFARKN